MGDSPGAVGFPEAADGRGRGVLWEWDLRAVGRAALPLARHLAMAMVLEFGQELATTET